MSRVSEFLTENPVQYLASVSLDGKAKCRPFMFSFEKDGKLWFNTGNFKLFLLMTRRLRRLLWKTRLLREIIRRQTIRLLKYFTWKMRMV